MTFLQTLEKINIFKLNAFSRMFKQYLLIIIGVITILFFVFHSYVLSIRQEKNTILANNYVTLKTELIKEQNIVDTLTTELFIQQPYLEDLDNFLRLEYNDYFEYKTNRYMSSESSNYFGTLTFIKKIFYSYPNCAKIIFHNKDTQSLTIFSNTSADFLERKQLALPNKVLNTTEIKNLVLNDQPTEEQLLAFHKTLNNPSTLENVADMYYLFDNQAVYQSVVEQNAESAGELFLMENDVLLYSTNNGAVSQKMATVQQDNLASNYQLVSRQSPKKIWQAIIHLYLYFLIITIIIILVSLPFIIHHLRNLEGKIMAITHKMTAIQTGNFTTVAMDKTHSSPDEFTLILDGLDEMSDQLKHYIDDVYVSEIKQKNYQMKTLRSQINPHFLYNTLEAIRMKAIINHDLDVSEMLYNTSRLYKNMIKGKELITLSEELSFCDAYLRLFEIRFEDNLFYDISFPEELASAHIEKLSIQPLVENYIVHGIDSTKDNNFIEIICERDQADILILVKDNGNGIPLERLPDIQDKLRNNAIESSDSMGLLNVNFRIKERFGLNYGVMIELNEWAGVTVTLRIPSQQKGDLI